MLATRGSDALMAGKELLIEELETHHTARKARRARRRREIEEEATPRLAKEILRPPKVVLRMARVTLPPAKAPTAEGGP